MAVAHVDSCVVDVLGARDVRGPRMALRIRFLGRRLEGTKERRKMGHREEGEEKEEERRKRFPSAHTYALELSIVNFLLVAPHNGLILEKVRFC